jgi:hypothetical protein
VYTDSALLRVKIATIRFPHTCTFCEAKLLLVLLTCVSQVPDDLAEHMVQVFVFRPAVPILRGDISSESVGRDCPGKMTFLEPDNWHGSAYVRTVITLQQILLVATLLDDRRFEHMY